MVAIPEWRSLAAVSIVLAVLAFGLLLIDGSGLKQRGRAFLALIAFGVGLWGWAGRQPQGTIRA